MKARDASAPDTLYRYAIHFGWSCVQAGGCAVREVDGGE